MILLLDTTVLIDALRNRTNLLVRLAGLVQDGHVLTTTTANMAEVYAGIAIHSPRELHCRQEN